MTPEEWDGAIAERLLRDAEAVAGELMQSLDEVADGFDSESFEASVTGDDHRLLRLAEDAVASAAGFFEQTLTDRQAESWSWRQAVSWSDESRVAMRVPGNVPGPDRTVTIRKDDDSLARRGRERI